LFTIELVTRQQLVLASDDDEGEQHYGDSGDNIKGKSNAYRFPANVTARHGQLVSAGSSLQE
jgi:hypothetical protein